MCRLLGWVAHPGTSLRQVLGEESFAAFAQLSRIHADGWGIASTDGPQVRVQKSVECAATDPSFLTTSTELVADAALAHLRWASPGLAVEERNSHPFLHGTAAFAHNGGIYPLDQLPGLLPPAWQAQLSGNTDSEHYFLAVLAEAQESGADLPTAIAGTAARLAADFRPSSLNAMLLTPEALYVVNCHDASLPSPPAPPERTVDGLIEQIELAAPYYDLRYRRSGRSVVVASSGFAQPEGGGWQFIPNNTVLVVDRATLRTEEHPLGVALASASAASVAGADRR